MKDRVAVRLVPVSVTVTVTVVVAAAYGAVPDSTRPENAIHPASPVAAYVKPRPDPPVAAGTVTDNTSPARTVTSSMAAQVIVPETNVTRNVRLADRLVLPRSVAR
ncbi:MAG: hypothetical protein OXI18_11675 [bacterium]|nr:hypothetical protein [bacterium]